MSFAGEKVYPQARASMLSPPPPPTFDTRDTGFQYNDRPQKGGWTKRRIITVSIIVILTLAAAAAGVAAGVVSSRKGSKGRTNYLAIGQNCTSSSQCAMNGTSTTACYIKDGAGNCYVEIGQPCTESTQCFFINEYYCQTSTTRTCALGPKMFNETCAYNYECSGYNLDDTKSAMACYSPVNRCLNTPGTSCSSDTMCGKNYDCINGYCSY